MGLRGPRRALDSRRGSVEFGQGAAIVQEAIEPPAGLNRQEARLFRQLVAENVAAGVAVRLVDRHQYRELSRLMIQLEATQEDVRLALAVSRRISDLRAELGMGPRARYRAGQADVQTAPKAPSKVQKILALAKARGV